VNCGSVTSSKERGPRQPDGEVLLHLAGPARQDDDAVGQEDRLIDIMGDEQHRDLVVFPDLQQQFLHHAARLCVEGPEGLIHQKDRGLVDQRPGDGDALAHAARELLRIGILEAGEPHRLDEVADQLFLLCLAERALFERETDVALDRHPFEQAVGLEDEAAIAPRPQNLGAVDADLARRWLVEAADDIEQRRLPQPEVPTMETNSFSLMSRSMRLDGGDGGPVDLEDLADAVYGDFGFHERTHLD
jgi:hypothetical protein